MKCFNCDNKATDRLFCSDKCRSEHFIEHNQRHRRKGKAVVKLGKDIRAPKGLQGATIETSWKQDEGTTVSIKHDNINPIPTEKIDELILALDKALYYLRVCFHPTIIKVGRSRNCHLIMFTASNDEASVCDEVLRHSTEVWSKT